VAIAYRLLSGPDGLQSWAFLLIDLTGAGGLVTGKLGECVTPTVHPRRRRGSASRIIGKDHAGAGRFRGNRTQL
jgi:hypothetical protein